MAELYSFNTWLLMFDSVGNIGELPSLYDGKHISQLITPKIQVLKVILFFKNLRLKCNGLSTRKEGKKTYRRADRNEGGGELYKTYIYIYIYICIYIHNTHHVDENLDSL